jgi:RNA polymerase sigma-70 factor (ECF subfamily)
VSAALAEAHRQEWTRVLAATVRVTRDLDLAQECAQDAYARALQTWPTTGVPLRPGAWLTTVARNRARDLVRREVTLRRILPLLVVEDRVAGPADVPGRPAVDDDRLRLVFTCCHPALAHDAQVALTLRLVCGLTTAEVARAFLVPESTMAARITRAKRKIAAAHIPYRVPPADELAERTGAVLDVVHLVFTTGHAAPAGEHLVRDDLCDASLRLARLLHELLPADHDVTALLALLLLTDARRAARVSASGDLVLLADQDRASWDGAAVAEGLGLLSGALRSAAPSRFAVQAAIAAVHAEAPTWERTDWTEVVGLYDVLVRLWPSPVVALNRAVALGERDGPEAGLGALGALLDEPALASYGYLAAARAALLHRLGRDDEAVDAYDEAIALTGNDVERAFLARRRAQAATNSP